MSAHHQLCNEVQHTEYSHHEITRSSHSKNNYCGMQTHKFFCEYMPAMPHEVGSQKQDQY